jgi:hypothetical protein
LRRNPAYRGPAAPSRFYVIPPGNALCAVTSGVPASANVSMAGSLSYTQY